MDTARPLTVELILGVAEGVLQFMSAQQAQAAWDAYNTAVQGSGIDPTVKTATATLTTAVDQCFTQVMIAAAIGAGAKLLGS